MFRGSSSLVYPTSSSSYNIGGEIRIIYSDYPVGKEVQEYEAMMSTRIGEMISAEPVTRIIKPRKLLLNVVRP